MWIYRQSTGELFHDQDYIETGYAGRGPGKNNPAMQNVSNIGPLPVGQYHILPAVRHPRLGPVALALEPAPETQLFGRAGFYIHGDSQAHPGQASSGCIVVGQVARIAIASGSDRSLKVVA